MNYCLKKYLEVSIFSMTCSFSILQQDEHNLHPQICCILFDFDIQISFFSFKPKSNSSRTIPSWERKVENGFIPSEVISQPEKWSTVVVVAFKEILSRFNFFNDLFFFNPSTRWTQPSSPNLLNAVWCWNEIFLISFKLKFNSSRAIPSWERQLEISFINCWVVVPTNDQRE